MSIIYTFLIIIGCSLYIGICALSMERLHDEILSMKNDVPLILVMIILASIIIGLYFELIGTKTNFYSIVYVLAGLIIFITLSCLSAIIISNYQYKR